MVKRLATDDPLEAFDSFCEIVDEKVIGVIGPSLTDSAFHVRSTADLKEMPVIETRSEGSPLGIINLHPSLEEFGRALLDIIDYYEWEEFTIIYENVTW